LSNGEDWIQQAQLELFDLRNGSQRTILARRNWSGEPGTPAVSPNGRTILYTGSAVSDQALARVNVTCVTPPGEDVASTS
jgi:hypothetical protein